MAPENDEAFRFRVTCGWLRDLASEPTPGERWPCIRWDERLLADQIRFLDVQAELGMTHNVETSRFPRSQTGWRFSDLSREKGLTVVPSPRRGRLGGGLSVPHKTTPTLILPRWERRIERP